MRSTGFVLNNLFRHQVGKAGIVEKALISVGQSRQTGGKASWCIINTENACFQILSTNYDTKKLISEVEEKDPEIKYLSKILKRK